MSAAIDGWFLRWQIRLLLVTGQKPLALARIGQRLAAVPDDAYALSTRAHLLAEQGDKAGAVAALEHLVQVQPAQASAWFNLGFTPQGISVDPEEIEEARHTLKKFIGEVVEAYDCDLGCGD